MVDEHWSLVVPKRDGVASEACLRMMISGLPEEYWEAHVYQLVDQRYQRLKVLFDCEVESISIL